MSSVFIHLTADVHPDAVLGDRVTIWNWCKVRERASIGAETKIGQCVYVDADVVIGARCKIQNGVSLYRGLSLGDGVFVGPNATFVNDRYPRAESEEWEVVPTVIEDGASIGANATILCGLRLGRYCMVAAGAIVTKDVPRYGLVVGQPAKLVGFVTRSGLPLQPGAGEPPPPEDLLLRG